jgi:hypothetical protein
MNVVLKIVAAAIAALIMAIGVTTRLGAPEPRSPSSAAQAPVASSVRASRIDVAINRPLPAAVQSNGASLRQRVERLLALGTPRDRYQAFVVLARCASALDFDRHLKSLPANSETMRLRQRYGDGSQRIAAACGDLSARQLEQRVELAASAADEGIAGAASAWVEEGPYGDKTALTQRPDDPLVVEWAQQAIARVNAATKRSDTEAIGQFGMLCLNWELDDIARVRLLVDAASERRHEDQIQSVLN